MGTLKNLAVSIFGAALGSLAIGYVRDKVLLKSLKEIDHKIKESAKPMDDESFFQAIENNHGLEVGKLFRTYVEHLHHRFHNLTLEDIEDAFPSAQSLWIPFLTDAKNYLQENT